ncbi:STAS-like domain-containing protein [Vibrio cyclitrophicus]|nr:STAS-like domain-containing protein [Vibrio cyclitrophicus]OBT17727.1 hypothetical protein A9266_17015 [Vibrio tasmaniensis]UPR52531.1 STAS-like domain-containing protein [Vibrio cyclitrophicus]
MMHTIDLAKDFSEFPFGRRSPEDGEFSGAKFRDSILKPIIEKLQDGDKINVDLNGVPVGIGSSFLSESFGGVVTKGYLTKEKFLDALIITCDDDLYEEEIVEYINESEAEVA